jgi:hypothetical protein
MTPKEKALILVYKFKNEVSLSQWESIQCALISVNLRIEGDFLFTDIEYGEDSLEYWQLVKQEIESL